MSRIGNKPVTIKEGVKVNLNNNVLEVSGPKGVVEVKIHTKILVEVREGEKIIVKRKSNDRLSRSLHGLVRTLINNAINGVTEGFEKKLEIKGVGYRAALEKNELVLSVGFSHLVRFKIPENIEVKVVKNIITVSGIDKQLVGEVASKIRDIKKPEPYKGKGIRYMNEYVIRKVGKAVKTGSTQ